MAAVSPASSPRLPSPPPIAEDQIGPTSPGLSLHEEHRRLSGDASIDVGAARRIRPGTKAEDMAEGPPLVELQDIDSAFQLTEHLKALHFHHTHPPDSSTTVPVDLDLARQLAHPPPNTSREIWLYELGRFLIQKTNAIIVGLFADSPACSPVTCPEMRASEWQYLCAVHDPPKSCSAIDYCCHTLDWAATSLTSSKMFPSRLDLGSKAAGSGVGGVGGVSGGLGTDKVLQQQMKEITNIFRRVYRIYAHAWFQHREMFWRVEGKTGLYIFFKTVCDEYGLIQPENYTIPSEAEGGEPEAQDVLDSTESTLPPPQVLKRESVIEPGQSLAEPAGNTGLARGDTTKRHRHTQSQPLNTPAAAIREEEAESAEDVDVKPSLDRQTTVLHESEPFVTLKEVAEEGEGGLEPSKTEEAAGHATDLSQREEAGEITIVEVKAEDESGEQPRSEKAMHAETSAVGTVEQDDAADADSATKSVED